MSDSLRPYEQQSTGLLCPGGSLGKKTGVCCHFLLQHGIREYSNFILLHVAIQFSQHHLLKRCLFSMLDSCLLCYRLDEYKYVTLFLGFLYCFIDLYFCLCVCVCVPVPCHLDYCSSALNLSKSSFGSFYNILCDELFDLIPSFIFSFLRLLWLFGIFCVSIQIVKFFALIL